METLSANYRNPQPTTVAQLGLTEADREVLPQFGNPAEAARAWAEVRDAKQKAEVVGL